MRLAYVVLSAAWLPSLALGQPVAGERSPQQRELILAAGGEEVNELYVAGRRPTALEFELPIRKETVHLTGLARGMSPPQVNGESLVLFPLADVPPEEHPVLTVGLLTGPLMRFALRSRPDRFDTHVKVTRSQPPSTQQCWSDADAAALAQCQQREKVAGLAAMMETLLKAELANAPSPWTRASGRFTSTEGPVALRWWSAYRAGEVVYLSMTLESPDIPWEIERVELQGAEGAPLEVIAATSRGVEGRPNHLAIVVGARVPADMGKQLRVELVAKDGRRARAEGLVLP